MERRLRQPEPRVNEYHEPRQLAQRLTLTTRDANETVSRRQPSRGAAAKRATAPSASSRSNAERRATRRTNRRRSAGRRNAAAPGSRQQDVLRLVNERPGVSVPQLGRELGVDPAGLDEIVRRLESRDGVRKDVRQLQPVAGEPRAADPEASGGAA